MVGAAPTCRQASSTSPGPRPVLDIRLRGVELSDRRHAAAASSSSHEQTTIPGPQPAIFGRSNPNSEGTVELEPWRSPASSRPRFRCGSSSRMAAPNPPTWKPAVGRRSVVKRRQGVDRASLSPPTNHAVPSSAHAAAAGAGVDVGQPRRPAPCASGWSSFHFVLPRRHRVAAFEPPATPGSDSVGFACGDHYPHRAAAA